MLRLLVLLSLFSLVLGAAVVDDLPGDTKVERSFWENLVVNSQSMISSLVNWLMSITGICTPETNLPSDVATLTAIAIMISLLIHVALYMVGKILNQPSTEAMLYNEVYVVISNVVLLLLILAIAYVFDQLDVFEKSQKYLIDVLVKNGIFQFFLLSLNQVSLEYSRIQIPLNPAASEQWFAAQADFGQAVKLILSVVGYVMNATALLTIQYVFKLFLLCLSGKFFLKILFPIGILLRSFYLTRGGANAILGIAIAFYVIYPVLLYLMAGVYDSVINVWLVYIMESLTSGFIILMNMATLYLLKFFQIYLINYIQAMFASLVPITIEVFNVTRTALLITLVTTLINFYINIVFGYGMFVMLFGFILGPTTIFITMIASGEISERLGTKINLSAFTRLI